MVFSLSAQTNDFVRRYRINSSSTVLLEKQIMYAPINVMQNNISSSIPVFSILKKSNGPKIPPPAKIIVGKDIKSSFQKGSRL